MVYHLLCKYCNENYNASSTSQRCPYCGKLPNKYQKVCKDCGYEWQSENPAVEKCPSCGGNRRKNFKMIKARKCHLKCQECGHEWIAGSAKSKCPKCLEKSLKSDSVKEFDRLKSFEQSEIKFLDGNEEQGLILLPINHGKMKADKICQSCNRKFRLNYPSQKYCGRCFKFKKCLECHNFFLTYSDGNFCSIRCSNIYRHHNERIFGSDNEINPKADYFKIFNENFPKNYHKYLEFLQSANPCQIERENFKNFAGKAGIWFKLNAETNEILDVLITNDILQEIEFHFKAIQNPIKKKFIEMSKIPADQIKFYYLCSFDTWSEGLILEMIFAIVNNAKYWSPSPGFQTKMVSRIRKID